MKPSYFPTSAICGFAATIALLLSCEKPMAEDDLYVSPDDANVILTFTPYTQQSFTRATPAASSVPSGSPAGTSTAATPAPVPAASTAGTTTRAATALTDCSTRLSVAIFTADGTKAKNITQKSTDASFGTVAFSLAAGSYKIVAVAHSSTEGNATITSPEKVTFASNKTTDTFSYCGALTVGDEQISETVEMQRVVAMFRLSLTDEAFPDDIQRLKFYYTGGSSTLDPTAGYGCVNSKQTEYRDCYTDDGSPVTTYDIYTFPHEQSDVLKLNITALASDGSSIGEWTMDNIPVTLNKITTWTGTLFTGTTTGGGTTQQGGITLTVDTDWAGTLTYTY